MESQIEVTFIFGHLVRRSILNAKNHLKSEYYRIEVNLAFKITLFIYNLPFLIVDRNSCRTTDHQRTHNSSLNWIFQNGPCSKQPVSISFSRAWSKEENERKFFGVCLSVVSNPISDTTEYAADRRAIKRWPLPFASEEIGYRTQVTFSSDKRRFNGGASLRNPWYPGGKVHELVWRPLF